MTELHFNHEGKQTFIRILAVDQKPGDKIVYEGMLNGREYFYWESDAKTEWTLFQDAIRAYDEHLNDTRTEIRVWEEK